MICWGTYNSFIHQVTTMTVYFIYLGIHVCIFVCLFIPSLRTCPISTNIDLLSLAHNVSV